MILNINPLYRNVGVAKIIFLSYITIELYENASIPVPTTLGIFEKGEGGGGLLTKDRGTVGD